MTVEKRAVEIGGGVSVGRGAPLCLIAGPCQLESLDHALRIAEAMAAAAEEAGLGYVFKASYDKANRSSRQSYRGPGLDEGLRILERVKQETGLPITTDVHEPGQAKLVAEVETALGPTSVLTGGYLVNGAPFAPQAGVPRVGEHSRQVLAELGYEPDVIDELVATGVVRSSTER